MLFADVDYVSFESDRNERVWLLGDMPVAIFLIILFASFWAQGTYAHSKANDDVSTQVLLAKAKKMVSINSDSAQSLAFLARNLARSKRDSAGIANANIVLGYIYSQKKDWPTPLERGILAKQITDNLNKRRTLSRVLFDIGEDYYRFAQKVNALKSFEFSARIAQKEEELQTYIKSLLRYAEISSEIGEVGRCNRAIEDALSALTDKDRFLRSEVYIAKGKIELARGNYASSIDSYNSALKYLISNDYADQMLCNVGIAQCNVFLKKYDQAERYLQLVEGSHLVDSNLKIRVPFLLAKAQYLENKDPKLAVETYKQYIQSKDSLYLYNEIEYIDRVRTDINAHKNEQEIDAIRQKVDLEQIKRRTFLVISLIMTILVVLFIFTIRRRNKILKRENENTKERIRLHQEHLKNLEERSIIEAQKEANKREMEKIEKERLQQLLERTELELDEKHRSLLTNSIQNEQYNEFLSELVDQLLKLKACNDKRIWQKEIDQLTLAIRSRINQTFEWEKIKLYFEKVHPSFFDKLKSDFPELTVNDLKFCAYTKLKLDGKEISRLLNINPSSVQISRYRLKRKMNLPEQTNFTDFIIEKY